MPIEEVADGDDILDITDLESLKRFGDLMNAQVVYNGHELTVSGWDFFDKCYVLADSLAADHEFSFTCDKETGKLCSLFGCTPSDVRAFINGANILNK